MTMRLFADMLTTSPVAAVDGQVDLGDQAAEREGAGDELAVDHAVVGLVGVAADDHVHFVVQAVDDIHDRAGDTDTAVDLARRRLWVAAFMDQHHDRLDALGSSARAPAR